MKLNLLETQSGARHFYQDRGVIWDPLWLPPGEWLYKRNSEVLVRVKEIPTIQVHSLVGKGIWRHIPGI